MGYHPECTENEIWVRNTSDPVEMKIIEITSVRLGKAAYDIHGEVIDGDECKPIIMSKVDYNNYMTILKGERK